MASTQKHNPDPPMDIVPVSGPQTEQSIAAPSLQPTDDPASQRYTLLSVSGHRSFLDLRRPFFGACRSVDDFQRLNRIGEGTYGVVYRARDRKTDEIVALKKIRMERETDGLPISSLREIMLLKRLNHLNIVNVKHVAVGGQLDAIFLGMEYCEQDLATLMDNVQKPWSISEVKCLMHQLLRGLEYCHDHYVIHRDIKLSNLLLTSQGVLKIADFGLARNFGLPTKPMTPKVVTLWYRAPELLLGASSYTTAVDMWSVGCVMGELLKHKPLLPGNTELRQIEMIVSLLGTPHEGIWQGFNALPLVKAGLISLQDQKYNHLKMQFQGWTEHTTDLLNRLLIYDPRKRATVKQALAHPYFTEAPLAKDPSIMPTYPEIRNQMSERTRQRRKHDEERKKRVAHDADVDVSFGGQHKRRAV